MKQILFIVNNGKISSNENGGAAVYFSHLEMLFKAGYKITLLTVQWGEEDVYIEEDYAEIQPMITAIIPHKIVMKFPFKGIKRVYNAIFKPENFEYYFLNSLNIKYLHNLVKENQIDLVWAEWRWAGIWAGFSKLKIPVIYAHHDWEYKLARLRKKRNFLGKFHTFQKKRVEYKMVKKVAGCISGSNTEKLEIEKITNKKALYIPTTYNEIVISKSANSSPNIVHLGGMGTTANRLGLERFLEVSWEGIKEKNKHIQLIVIGSLKQAHKSLLEKLESDTRISCLGFVKDLSEVLYPNDIHIIPWEYNTGTRTRLPVVLNYKQVLVATQESVKAFPELEHQKNAILCEDLQGMVEEICILSEDLQKLNEIGENAKKTFSKLFTSDANFKKIKEYIDSL